MERSHKKDQTKSEMRKFLFIFSPSVSGDEDKAFEYYESLQPGLGVRFLNQLELTYKAIKRNPLFASVRYDDIRCAQVKKFPYLVHYHINKKEAIVSIIAVYSTHQEPFE